MNRAEEKLRRITYIMAHMQETHPQYPAYEKQRDQLLQQLNEEQEMM